MPRRLSRRGGGSAADVGALFTPDAPEKYALLAFETDTTEPVLRGGREYAVLFTVAPRDGYICPYCGETHNGKTVSGWWTELLHHVLFVVSRVFFWWSK